jgi:hypothetical protein
MTINGSAFWGIPSFKNNNQNRRNRGELREFPEPGGWRLPRILPVVSLVALTTYLDATFYLIRPPQRWGNNLFEGPGIARLLLLSLPLAGTLNNFIWRGASYSGAKETLTYNLLTEYPEVDLIVYPKYTIVNHHVFEWKSGFNPRYFWFQDSELTVRAKGATLLER